MFFLRFLFSAIPDLGILNMLIRECFPGALQHSHKKQIVWKHGLNWKYNQQSINLFLA